MSDRLSNILLIPFTAVIVAGFVFLFYYSPDYENLDQSVNKRVENKLFDIRTRLAFSQIDSSKLAVVEIDKQSVLQLEGNGAKSLSIRKLIEVSKEILNQRAKSLVVFLHPQIYSIKSDDFDMLIDFLESNPQVYLGGFDRVDPPLADLSPEFANISEKLLVADAIRFYRRDVMRRFIVERAGIAPTVSLEIAKKINPNLDTSNLAVNDSGDRYITLNYISPKQINSAKAKDLFSNKSSQILANKHVYLGFTYYFPYDFRHREASFINTPWQNDSDDLEYGMPVVYLQAIATLNLTYEKWLKNATQSANVLQVVVVSVAALLIWRFSVGFASFLFIGGWSALILLHGVMFSKFNFYIPLSDSLLFSSIATIIGALIKLRLEGQSRAIHEARTQSEKDLANVQDKFLNKFSFELSEINHAIFNRLRKYPELADLPGTKGDSYRKALGSSEELSEYLQGMQQFSNLRGKELTRIVQFSFNVKQQVDIVLKQFEIRCADKSIGVFVDIDEHINALGDKNLFAQIIFNLISNAIKYSPSRSEIKVTAEVRGKKVLVSVKDQGPGISKEFQDQIFEKFYRIKNDSVYHVKGHGLGLYLSQYFAEQLGAKISLKSQEGQGSTFILTLGRGK